MTFLKSVNHKLVLFLILIFAFGVRVYGLNWDQNQHLHPDERFLTMVAGAMQWPKNLGEYFDTTRSKLNPHNIGFNFYVYGTYPVILVKYLAGVVKLDDYDSITLVGRFISAVIDTLVVFIVYLIAVEIFKKKKVGLWAAFFYSIMVLPIQLSHFFAVDTFSNFFIVLSFYLLIRSRFILLGISFGLAMAAKISAVTFVPIIAIFPLHKAITEKKWMKTIFSGFVCLLFCVLSFRLAQPYLFRNIIELNHKVLNNWKELETYLKPDIWYPPSTMWMSTGPLVLSFNSFVFLGVGFPLAVLIIIGLVIQLIRSKNFLLVFWGVWIIGVFIWQGTQFAKPMRYFISIYPFLAIFAGVTFVEIKYKIKYLLLPLILIWPMAFLSIYSNLHSRVDASIWIYNNVPQGSTIACEHWDDCLPLNIPGYIGSGGYKYVELPMYGMENDLKWQQINERLTQADYLVLSSNRIYGSTVDLPKRYPKNIEYFKNLFSGNSQYKKIAEFVSRPTLAIPKINYCFRLPYFNYGIISGINCSNKGLEIIDDFTEESFTVYDHPRVIIFKKASSEANHNFPQLFQD